MPAAGHEPDRARVDDDLHTFPVSDLDQWQGNIENGYLEAGRCFAGASEERELIRVADVEHWSMMPKPARAAQ
jgi:hypothetical protein